MLGAYFPGCSEETPPELAEGTYAASYRAQIETDCDKRVVCADRSNPYLAEDAFDECVLEQARKLNVPPPNPPVPGQPDHRLKFQLGIHRCTNPDQCHYVACVDSGVTSFGEVQIDKVTYTCQQKVQCQIDSALLAGDATSIYESCILQSIVVLDTTPQTRERPSNRRSSRARK